MSLRKLPAIQAFRQTDQLEFGPDVVAEEKFVPTLRAANDGDENTISIYGQIGYSWDDGIHNNEKRISAALRKIGNRDVVVNINSPGGDLIAGLAIYNLLRIHPAKVTMNVVALAGSAASVIAMAGDQINVAAGSFIMVHRASVLAAGNTYEMQSVVELLGEMDAAMASIYASRTGASEVEALAWMDKSQGRGSMFNTSTAIEKGLADAELAAKEIKALADVPKLIPPERTIEQALMDQGKTSAEAKTIISQMKSGTRDAAVPVTRDAGKFEAAMKQLQTVLKS
ncbi:head maturation protease, ClpP-related [Maritalea sp.]|uniref:head maturation protease, ClpP-related n=1 Tax=Maritalea sp. TaxID=2003361 RepID=UPI003EF415B9